MNKKIEVLDNLRSLCENIGNYFTEFKVKYNEDDGSWSICTIKGVLLEDDVYRRIESIILTELYFDNKDKVSIIISDILDSGFTIIYDLGERVFEYTTIGCCILPKSYASKKLCEASDYYKEIFHRYNQIMLINEKGFNISNMFSKFIKR